MNNQYGHENSESRWVKRYHAEKERRENDKSQGQEYLETLSKCLKQSREETESRVDDPYPEIVVEIQRKLEEPTWAKVAFWISIAVIFFGSGAIAYMLVRWLGA